MTAKLTELALSVALGDIPKLLSVCGHKRLSFLGQPIPHNIIEQLDVTALHNALNAAKRTAEDMMAELNKRSG